MIPCSLIRAQQFGVTLFMPKREAQKPQKGRHPDRRGSRDIEGRGEGKPISPQGKPLRDGIPAHRSAAQVREWKAREDGLVAGRERSLERRNPREQRIVRGVTPAGG
jgi:hypothetical protein